MQDFLSGLKGFPQRQPSFVSRLADVRGGTFRGSSVSPIVSIKGFFLTPVTLPIALSINITTSTNTSTNPLVSAGGYLIRSQINGLDRFWADTTGTGFFAGGLTVASGSTILDGNSNFRLSGKATIFCPTDGIMTLYNNATTDFTRLQFGGTTSSFPAIGRSGASLEIFGADGIGPSALWVYNTKTSATNFERLDIQWAANVAQVWTEAGGGGGTARDFVLGANAIELHRFSGASQAQSFFGATPVVKQTSGANLTNNVTAGGTTDQIDNFTDLVIYGNDATAIRNDIYQLARKLKQINDGLRSYGLFT